jgi:60 kDa SS-A/Ro ribonucleoprotein
MTRFNSATPTLEARTKTTNKAGGEGYKSSPELELVSTMLTSFVQDKFYESGKGTIDRLGSVLTQVDPEFAAKAAIYARDEFNMRSVSHVAAGELATLVSGEPWAKDFYEAIVVRPDDMTEITSYVQTKHGIRMTSAMKKGFAAAFNKFDSYQLSRHRAEDKKVSLVDIANLSRPKPTNDKAADALHALVNGTLRQERTFEAKLSAAGQKASTPEEKKAAKAQAWGETVQTMGYMALLKNLRNIMQDAPEALDTAIARLTTKKAVENSRVLPLRFVLAYREIEKLAGHPRQRDVLRAISKAMDLAVANVPKFEGTTLVAFDVSASMRGGYYGRNKGFADLPPSEIGALFSAILAKANDADFMTFDGSARYHSINTLDSTMTIGEKVSGLCRGGTTNFASVFETANKKYDRIIVLTDMQSWVDIDRRGSLRAYRQKFSANPHLYLFNLNDYGTLLFPENKVYNVAGFSEKVFDVMHLLESDRQALVNAVKSVKFK